MGPVVDGLLKAGEEVWGKSALVMGDMMGHKDMVDIWSKRKFCLDPVVPGLEVENSC